MADIQYWDDTLAQEIDQIQELLDKVPSIGSSMEKTAAIERTKSRIRSAAGTKRSFKMEIRLVQDVQLRRKYESRLNQLDQELKTLQSDCKALEAESARGELFVESSGDNENGRHNELDGVKAGDAMLKEASQIQDRTQESLTNTTNMIAASKEVGAATLEELERQRNVIENIENEADRIDDNLARAEKLLKHFGKRMATDQFIQCFAVVNCLLLIGVVLYAIFKKGSLTGGSDPPRDPTQPLRYFLRRE